MEDFSNPSNQFIRRGESQSKEFRNKICSSSTKDTSQSSCVPSFPGAKLEVVGRFAEDFPGGSRAGSA